MEVVSTELDPIILAAAGLGVLLLVGVLVMLSRVVSSNKQIMLNQQNQNNLLLSISNVLSTNAEAEKLQLNRQETRVSEKSGEQGVE